MLVFCTGCGTSPVLAALVDAAASQRPGPLFTRVSSSRGVWTGIVVEFIIKVV